MPVSNIYTLVCMWRFNEHGSTRMRNYKIAKSSPDSACLHGWIANSETSLNPEASLIFLFFFPLSPFHFRWILITNLNNCFLIATFFNLQPWQEQTFQIWTTCIFFSPHLWRFHCYWLAYLNVLCDNRLQFTYLLSRLVRESNLARGMLIAPWAVFLSNSPSVRTSSSWYPWDT